MPGIWRQTELDYTISIYHYTKSLYMERKLDLIYALAYICHMLYIRCTHGTNEKKTWSLCDAITSFFHFLLAFFVWFVAVAPPRDDHMWMTLYTVWRLKFNAFGYDINGGICYSLFLIYSFILSVGHTQFNGKHFISQTNGIFLFIFACKHTRDEERYT